MGGDRMLIKNYTWIDFLNVFWGIDEGCPMCFQFWFLRDLIIVSLLSPIVFLIAKKWRFLVLALLALWFFDYKIPLPGLNSSVITFFTLGAFLSLNKMTDKDVPQSSFNIFVILYFVLFTIEVALYNTNLSDTICFHLIYKVGVLIGVFVFPLYYYFYHNKNVNSFLEKGSFFVYAAHGVLVSIFTRLLLSAIPVNSDLRALGDYFLIPVLSVSACLLSYYILKRFLPKFTSILTGGKI